MRGISRYLDIVGGTQFATSQEDRRCVSRADVPGIGKRRRTVMTCEEDGGNRSVVLDFTLSLSAPWKEPFSPLQSRVWPHTRYLSRIKIE